MTFMQMNPLIGKNIDDENISFELGDDPSCTFSNLKSAIIPGSSLGGTDPNTKLVLAYVNSDFLQIDVITISNTNYGLKFSTKFQLRVFIFKPGESKITKYRIETAVAAEKQVVAISIDELTEDLIITFEDKIARIAVVDLESFRKRLGRQIIKDKCGFQIAPNNMEKFKDFQIINLDREAQLTPLGTVLRRKSG